MERLIVDRIEGNYAVCEESTQPEPRLIPLEMIYGQVSEGDILVPHEDAGYFMVDKDAAENRRAEMRRRFDKIINKDAAKDE